MKTDTSHPGRSILARRLIQKTLVFGGLATLFLTLILGGMVYYFGKTALDRQFQKIESSYIDFIRPALWVTDKEMVDVLLMGIVNLPEMAYAGIHVNGTVVCEKGERDETRHPDRIIPVNYLYNGTTRFIGDLYVQADKRIFWMKIVRDLIMAASIQAVTIFIFCGAVLWLIFRLLIQRLGTITRYTATISMETLETPLILGRTTTPSNDPDELDTLADTINAMRQHLHQELTGRKKAEAQLQAHLNDLEQTVEKRTADLQTALSEVKTLSGLLPICMHCKKIRDDQGHWQQMETYIHNHSNAQFSHGLCRECAQKHYPDLDIYKNEKG
jgi:hypothetical protein